MDREVRDRLGMRSTTVGHCGSHRTAAPQLAAPPACMNRAAAQTEPPGNVVSGPDCVVTKTTKHSCFIMQGCIMHMW